MKNYRFLLYSIALVAFIVADHYLGTPLFFAFLPLLPMGACDELTDFATATENLDDDILRSPRLGRAKFWWNAIPHGTFIKNKGVVNTVFNMKPSEPIDDNSLWTPITLDGDTGQPTPSCSTDYEEIQVGFYRRTYGPKRRDFLGPVLCKRDFTFQHDIEDFLNGYVDEIGRYITRIWEFALRADYMDFGDVFVDYVKYNGPNALATVPIPELSLDQDMLDQIATDLSNVGAGEPDEKGYVMDRAGASMYSLYIDQLDSANVIKNNPERRVDAQYASMGKGTESNLSLWKAIGEPRTIGNFMHVQTDIAPRANNVGGVLVPVSPFKAVGAIGSDGETLTAAYMAARYAAAIVVVPGAMTAEIVTPTNWRFPTVANYMGDLEFIIGGEKICTPPVFDPRGERGRHVASIEYAARPRRPFYAKTIWYKRCGSNQFAARCPAYT